MKRIYLVITIFIGCLGYAAAQTSNADVLKVFLKGIVNTDQGKINSHSPIDSIMEIAKSQAAKTMQVTKENIEAALKEAKDYKYCIIIVAHHTIIKVTDFSKTAQSGSWGTKMPFCEGYILKGTMVNLKDYLNNIIGKPDEQNRTMYLFK